jgi:hypothetical protein
MRTLLFGLALCVNCLGQLAVVVPPSAAHPQDWLHPQIRQNPKPGSPGKLASTLAEFVAPEVISKIVVDQYAGPPDDVRHYLTALPTAAAQYFGQSLELCTAGARLVWTSTSTVTFDSGKSGRLAVATVNVSKVPSPKVFGLSPAPDCFGFDKVRVDSIYVSYIDPDGYTWAFAVPLQRKK